VTDVNSRTTQLYGFCGVINALHGGDRCILGSALEMMAAINEIAWFLVTEPNMEQSITSRKHKNSTGAVEGDPPCYPSSP